MSMKAVEVPEPGADFELVERDIPEPADNELRVDVDACGICHSDAFVKEGMMPGIEYPRVPGHEVVGVVDAVGDDVEGWEEGDRVGFGWHGGHCFQCDPCRDGDFLMCEGAEITGLTFDGGYAEYMTGPAEAAARVPDGLDANAAAPLLCAGITVFNALRHTDASPGDLVAIQGIGGLGHLGIQYAVEAGYETVAVSGSPDKEELARDLGADHFVAASEVEPAEALQELGGADVALATAPAADPITALVGGLGRDGELVVVGATDEPVEIPPLQLIQPRTSVRGWPSGTAPDSEDTLEFSDFADVEPMIEVFPLEEAGAAYQRMIDNDVRFRSVLEMP
jgi:D-arabinose 1-dehydrogenase-like Zn-dependent alcohol dehydrogenase